jgi:hypothetical protein
MARPATPPPTMITLRPPEVAIVLRKIDKTDTVLPCIDWF